MGLDFLRTHGANRLRGEVVQPIWLESLVEVDDAATSQQAINHNYEEQAAEWRPKPISPFTRDGWSGRPIRFIDGKDVGRTVAWMRDRMGFPIPIRLSEIGAVVLRDEAGTLRREPDPVVERVVTLAANQFPWDEIEGFAAALQSRGFRLLIASVEQPTYDFEEMNHSNRNRSRDEMVRLERQMLFRASDVPTLVDGRLDPRTGAFDPACDPVVGMIKTHSRNYLHDQGWRTYFDLEPGQRTPAFTIKTEHLEVVSWFVRLDGSHGEAPNTGIVRLEIPQAFFERSTCRDFDYLDRLAGLVYAYRCRDHSYGRAAISLYPIQRAEEELAAQFLGVETLAARFYHLTEL
jgi:hypothetical protein